MKTSTMTPAPTFTPQLPPCSRNLSSIDQPLIEGRHPKWQSPLMQTGWQGRMRLLLSFGRPRNGPISQDLAKARRRGHPAAALVADLDLELEGRARAELRRPHGRDRHRSVPGSRYLGHRRREARLVRILLVRGASRLERSAPPRERRDARAA